MPLQIADQRGWLMSLMTGTRQTDFGRSQHDLCDSILSYLLPIVTWNFITNANSFNNFMNVKEFLLLEEATKEV